MFHKEGYKIILITLFLAIGIALASEFLIDSVWIKRLILIAIIIFLVAVTVHSVLAEL